MTDHVNGAPGMALDWGRRYLMCPPTHYDVSYSINPWMDTAVSVDRLKAGEQWEALVATLEAAGAQVERLDPAPELPDLVFTANAGIVDGRTFVASRMRHRERRPEPGYAARWFAQRGYEIRHLPESVVQEGAGDALPFADTLVAGYRTRSSAGAYVEIARLVGSRILPVELVDPRLYHIDLVFCPLDDRHALVAGAGLDADGRRLIEQLVPEPLMLTEQEAYGFTCNSVVIGKTVVMPRCPPRVRAQLEAWGFQPVVVDVSEFLKAGGGPRCLTLALDVKLTPGGDEGAGEDAAQLADRYAARNYNPLPVTVARAEGAWVHDEDGRAYLDALSAYSALNFGHRHPALVSAAKRQLDRVTLTSRAFHNDQLGPFARELAELCGKDRVLLMNTGAEAVETAIKTARKWGYEVKGVAPDRARIVTCAGNFHGRTTTIVSFSDDPQARGGFGPFTPGFDQVPYGDAAALEAAIADDTVAFLVEPIQGEAGVIVPPAGYLRAVREICSRRDVLLIADEIQSGLGRTGRTFACEHEGVEPDVYVLGKALGGGVVPLSAVVADDDVLGVFRPGDHGSTFGGNPLACAVGREVLKLLRSGEPQRRAEELGQRMRTGLEAARLELVREIRSRGLWFGLELREGAPPARAFCERLLSEGLLCKDTHEHTIRLAPPLTISDAECDWLVERLVRVLVSPTPAAPAAAREARTVPAE